MSPKQPSTSTFFAGGTSPKAPRFGSSPGSKRRPFTPGSTRDDLAQKRAAEAARQAQSLGKSPLSSPLGGSALQPPQEEPRTSFSDDMGRAFDDIGMAASKPLPPSHPATPHKMRPSDTNGARAAAEQDVPPQGTAMLGEAPLPAAPSTAPREEPSRLAVPTQKPVAVRQASNPVKDVTTADLDGVPVFFIDSGLDGGLPGQHANVVSITASPDRRNQRLADDYQSQRASAQPGFTTSHASSHDSQQLASQPITGVQHFALEASPQPGSHFPAIPTEGYTDQQLYAQPDTGVHISQQLSSHPDTVTHDLSMPDELADRTQRRTFGQPPIDDSTPLHDASSNVARGTTHDAQNAQAGGAPGAGFGSPGAGFGGPGAGFGSPGTGFGTPGKESRGGFADHTHIYGAAGAVGAAGAMGVAASALSGERDQVNDVGGASRDVPTHDVAGTHVMDQQHPPMGEHAVEDTQNLSAAPHTQDFAAADASAASPTPPAPDAPWSTGPGAYDAQRPSGITQASDMSGGGGAPAFPEGTGVAFPAARRPRAMSSVSAVPDDLDQECLPELNTEDAREPPMSPPSRDLAASPASVPDDYDACVPLQHQYTNSVDSVPLVNAAGAAPPSDQGADYVRESERESPTASPVLGPGGHAVLLTPTTDHVPEDLRPHAFPEGTESYDQHHAGMSMAGAGALAAAAGVGAGAATLGATKRMPEERSMSAASVVAIKDGRTGVPGAVRTSNLVCEPAPKTGETYMTSGSLTASDVSLAGGDTRRGNEAAESTASITAIRGGNEGAPPSPPGRSPLAVSRTADEVMDEAYPESREAEHAEREGSHGDAFAGAGAAGAAGLVAAGGLAAHRDIPEERGHADASEDLRTSQLHRAADTTEPTAVAERTAERQTEHTAETREIQSPSPRRDENDFHTATTSTPANESFMTGTETTPAHSTPLAGETTPHAPGDYITAGSGRSYATTPHAPGAWPVDPPKEPEPQQAHYGTSAAPETKLEPVADEEAETPVAKTLEPTVSAPETPTATTQQSTAPASAAAATGVGATTIAAPSTNASAVKTNGADQPERNVERKPVPAESSSGPSRPTASAPGHSRTNSKSSAGSGRKVGFMSKLKGEFKVLSGKFKHDDKMVAEGERMKHGE